MYNIDLTEKVALVTGGSRGIGRFIAEALCAAGAEVAITGRNEAALRDAAEDIGSRCRPYVCDQRDVESVHNLVVALELDFGPVDILVNNAGVMYGGMNVADMPLDAWNDTLLTNLTGVFLVTQAFLPGMIEQDSGDIFMISSTSGKRGDPGWSAYAASKFGLQGFAQSLLQEVRAHNIRVVVLNPSSVDTSPDVGSTEGAGLKIHAADIAAAVVQLSALPRRTLVRDVEIWGTNP